MRVKRFYSLAAIMCSISAICFFFLLLSFSLTRFSIIMTDDRGLHDTQSHTMSHSSIDPLQYFGYNVSSNAGLITWAHAVNSRRLFREAVDGNLDFLEADILMRDDVPIMAHPPAIDSDLTLTDFLESSFPLRKGIKLDFKTIDALRGSVSVLSAYWTRRAKLDVSLKCPFWMNADIVGHGSVQRGKVDAEEFLATARSVTPGSSLSLGWNIHPDYFAINTDGELSKRLSYAYSDDDVRRMRDAIIERVSPSQSITFAVWAKFITGSNETLKWLTNQFPESTLTIWGGEGDASVGELEIIYAILPSSRVFIDLPLGLREGLLSDDIHGLVNHS